MGHIGQEVESFSFLYWMGMASDDSGLIGVDSVQGPQGCVAWSHITGIADGGDLFALQMTHGLNDERP